VGFYCLPSPADFTRVPQLYSSCPPVEAVGCLCCLRTSFPVLVYKRQEVPRALPFPLLILLPWIMLLAPRRCTPPPSHDLCSFSEVFTIDNSLLPSSSLTTFDVALLVKLKSEAVHTLPLLHSPCESRLPHCSFFLPPTGQPKPVPPL